MKYFEEMTEEEVLEYALAAVSTYRERIRQTGKFDLDECVALELARLEDLFLHRRVRPEPSQGFSLLRWLVGEKKPAKVKDEAKEQAQLKDVIEHYKPLLRERTFPMQQRYLRGRKVSEINSVSAKALLNAKLQKYGLKATLTGQRYRIRIQAPLGKVNSLRFYVSYKEMSNDERLDEVVDAMHQMQEAMDKLGTGAVVEWK